MVHVTDMNKEYLATIVVPSVSHAVWNGNDYPLFGFGERVRALGIQQTHIYGPEVGLMGIAPNVLFAAALYSVIKKGSVFSSQSTVHARHNRPSWLL